MNWKLLGLAIVVAPAFAAPAFAHHSFSMFDADKTVTLNGTVKEFEWTNPHAWLRVMVNDPASGKSMQYAVEMGSPGQQARVGWKPDLAEAGRQSHRQHSSAEGWFARRAIHLGGAAQWPAAREWRSAE